MIAPGIQRRLGHWAVYVVVVTLALTLATSSVHAKSDKGEDKGIPAAKLAQYEDLMTKKKYSRALNLANQILEQDTQDGVRHAMVGRAAMYIRGKEGMARDAFRIAQAKDQKNHIILRYTGEWAENLQDLAVAATAYARAGMFWAKNESPSDFGIAEYTTFCELARKATGLFVASDRYGDALEVMRRHLMDAVPAAQASGDDSEFWAVLDGGVNLYHSLLLLQKDYSTAIAMLDQLMKMRPSSFQYPLAMARTYAAKGDHQLAIDNANLALQKTSTTNVYDEEDQEAGLAKVRAQQTALVLIVQAQISLGKYKHAAVTSTEIPSEGLEPKMTQLSALLRGLEYEKARAVLQSIKDRVATRDDLSWNYDVFGRTGMEILYSLPLSLRQGTFITRSIIRSIRSKVSADGERWWDDYLSDLADGETDDDDHDNTSSPVLRIAIISSSFQSNAVGRSIAAFLKAAYPYTQNQTTSGWLGTSTQSATVHIDCIDVNPTPKSDISQFVQALCTKYFSRPGRNYQDHAALIRGLRSHVLYDIGGVAMGSFETVVARPAPVSLTGMAHLGSIGLSSPGHYLTVDKYTVPPHVAHRYPESLLYMPESYQVFIQGSNYVSPWGKKQGSEDVRAVVPRVTDRAAYKIAGQGLVYCYHGPLWAIDEQVFNAWAQILKESDDKSILWLKDTAGIDKNAFYARLNAYGVPKADARVRWAPTSNHHDVVRRLQLCDLYLDSPNSGSYNEVPDALFAGVPVLTYPLESQPARAVYSQLVNFLGSEDAARQTGLIVNSMSGYVKRAVQLSRDPAALAALKSTFQRRSGVAETTTLFNDVQHTRNTLQCLQGLVDVSLLSSKRMHLVCSSVSS